MGRAKTKPDQPEKIWKFRHTLPDGITPEEARARCVLATAQLLERAR